MQCLEITTSETQVSSVVMEMLIDTREREREGGMDGEVR